MKLTFKSVASRLKGKGTDNGSSVRLFAVLDHDDGDCLRWLAILSKQPEQTLENDHEQKILENDHEQKIKAMFKQDALYGKHEKPLDIIFWAGQLPDVKRLKQELSNFDTQLGKLKLTTLYPDNLIGRNRGESLRHASVCETFGTRAGLSADCLEKAFFTLLSRYTQNPQIQVICPSKSKEAPLKSVSMTITQQNPGEREEIPLNWPNTLPLRLLPLVLAESHPILFAHQKQLASIPEAAFGISLVYNPRDLGVKLTYNTELFSEQKMQLFLENVKKAYETLLQDGQLLPTFSIISDEYKEKILQWNHLEKETLNQPPLSFLIELFENRACDPRFQDTPAVKDPTGQLSYGELNECATRLAHHLLENHAGENNTCKQKKFVALLERSNLYVIAYIALMKLGAIFMPLSPRDPEARLIEIIKTAKYPCILSNESIPEIFQPGHSGDQYTTVDISEFAQPDVRQSKCQFPPLNSKLSLDDVAFLVHTSGGSGSTPKGVLVKHRGLSNWVLPQQEIDQIGEADRVLLAFRGQFDACLAVIQIALLNGQGAELIIYPDTPLLDRADLANFVNNEMLSHAMLPAKEAYALLETIKAKRDEGIEFCPHLHTISSTADKCTMIMKRLAQELRIRLLNAYGPTETTYGVSVREVTEQDPIPLVGTAIRNTQLLVLDKEKRLCPPGVPGDMWIGGVSLAEYTVPSLTELFFKDTPDHLKSYVTSEKIYYTGDVGVLQPNGNINCLGRFDDRVNINGQLVDTESVADHIRKVLLDIAPDTTTVKVLKMGGKLVAAIEKTERIDGNAYSELEATLKERLSETLASYEVPSAIHLVDKFPTTSNGAKININTLREILQPDYDVVKPRNSLESLILKTYQVIMEGPSFCLGENVESDYRQPCVTRALALDSAVGLDLINSLNDQLFPERTFDQRRAMEHIKHTIEEKCCADDGEYRNGITIAALAELYRPYYYTFTSSLSMSSDNQGPVAILFPDITGKVSNHLTKLVKKACPPHSDIITCSLGLKPSQEADIPSNQAECHANYLISAIYPKRPIILIGWSAGGNMARDVAYFLTANNREVEQVVMLDSISNRYLHCMSPKKFQEHLDFIVKHLINLYSNYVGVQSISCQYLKKAQPGEEDSNPNTEMVKPFDNPQLPEGEDSNSDTEVEKLFDNLQPPKVEDSNTNTERVERYFEDMIDSLNDQCASSYIYNKIKSELQLIETHMIHSLRPRPMSPFRGRAQTFPSDHTRETASSNRLTKQSSMQSNHGQGLHTGPLPLPTINLFPAADTLKLHRNNGWNNSWDDGNEVIIQEPSPGDHFSMLKNDTLASALEGILRKSYHLLQVHKQLQTTVMGVIQALQVTHTLDLTLAIDTLTASIDKIKKDPAISASTAYPRYNKIWQSWDTLLKKANSQESVDLQNVLKAISPDYVDHLPENASDTDNAPTVKIV